MKTRTILSLGLSALVLGGTMVGCTANGGGLASAGTRDAASAARVAAKDAAQARDALADGKPAQAVASAERAVGLMPQNAGYRALLAQGYLKLGRFASARSAFTDVLALEPTDGRSALNLALAEIALGDWQAARKTLDAHHDAIPLADRGLALALAGDPAGGAQLLTEVVRSGQATPKARQNLALALALAGQWQGARVVAAADMSPAEVDRRLEQWAAFAQPKSASDQVAALLGVAPAEDPGQPVALALVAAVPVGTSPVEVPVAASAPASLPVAMIPAAAPPTIPTAAATPADVALATAALAPRAENRPVVAPLLRAAPGAIKVALARPVAPARSAPTTGKWYVQVGAFRNAAVAQSGWRTVTRRMPALARNVPTTARFAARGGAFYRLAFGGFGRADADAVCRRLRSAGGACFVRTAAGDQIASWAGRQPIQLASR